MLKPMLNDVNGILTSHEKNAISQKVHYCAAINVLGDCGEAF